MEKRQAPARGDRARAGATPRAALHVSAALLLALALLATLAGCERQSDASAANNQPATALPGGVYSSAQYHFSVTYPSGWQSAVDPVSLVNTTPTQGSAAATKTASPIFLTVSFTRTGARASDGSFISSLTVTVFDARNKAIAQSITKLPKDTTLRKVTLAGLPAFQSASEQRQVPGTQRAVTHTDYYLPHANLEYQISVESVAGENADDAFQSMLDSLKITG